MKLEQALSISSLQGAIKAHYAKMEKLRDRLQGDYFRPQARVEDENYLRNLERNVEFMEKRLKELLVETSTTANA